MLLLAGLLGSMPSLAQEPVVMQDTLADVVVSSHRPADRIKEVQIGVEKVNIAELGRVPVLFGERDIIKGIQLLPGVKQESDVSSGFQVRGGTSAQNLILLDDATIYNAGHLMGLFSTFNDDVLQGASLYKGMIPAQLGGATSSVLDIDTKAGNQHGHHLSATIGLLSAKLSAQGPLVKDKLSYFVAGRRSYMDLFLKATEDYKDNMLNFYDLNARFDFRAGPKDYLTLSLFNGRDNLGLEDMMSMKWSNTSAVLRWHHDMTDRVYNTLALIASDYRSDVSIDVLKTDYAMQGYISHLAMKDELTWQPTAKHKLKMGLQTDLIALKSAEWDINLLHQKEKRKAWENAIWVNEEWQATSRMQLSAGLRLDAFTVLGGAPFYEIAANGDIAHTYNYKSGKFVKTYLLLEPRLSVNYKLSDAASLKAGYSRTSQNLHAIRNASMSMPFDRYTMSSNIVKPQTAHQLSLGYMQMVADGDYDFSVEGYYKTVDNVYDYRDGKAFYSEIEIERIILGGKGRAYGLEAMLHKNNGPLTGWVAYTLSWAENKIDGINQNRWYTASNDRRHDISVVGMYKLSRRWELSATWVYNTGQAMTVPGAKYEAGGDTFYYYPQRNGYRAPAYHHLDLGAIYTIQARRFTSQWSFGLYNVYNHYNPFAITISNDDQKPSGTKATQTALFGIVPSVSYTIKF